MRELTYSELAQAEDALQTEAALQMDEGSFRALYNRTARALWAYLAKVTGDSAAADDLMQECYYRFLRARHPTMSDEQAKQYLFRIATNLLRDRWRRGRAGSNVPLDEMEEVPTGERTAEGVQARSDLKGALRQLTPREVQLLWLAYVEGSSSQGDFRCGRNKSFKRASDAIQGPAKTAGYLAESGHHRGWKEVILQAVPKPQSFPRKRESTSETFATVVAWGWIPAFAGMTGAIHAVVVGAKR